MFPLEAAVLLLPILSNIHAISHANFRYFGMKIQASRFSTSFMTLPLGVQGILAVFSGPPPLAS
jgi:hypothetical protein